MKRVTATLVAVTLGLAACGGDDDTNEADEATAEQTAEPDEAAGADGDGDAGDTEATDEGADESSDGDDADGDGDGDASEADEEPAADESSEPPADDGGDDSQNSGVSVSSLDDIPQVCKDAMADLLQELEPIVEPIDWQQATLADFEAIAAEFQTIGEEFEGRIDERECDLDIEDEDSIDLIVEFADQEAPGTVPFWMFLDETLGAFAPDDGEDGEPGTALPGGDFENCDQAIEFIEGLLDQYDSFQEVPVSDITKIAGISSVIMTCTPEQMEVLDSPEFNDFMSGS